MIPALAPWTEELRSVGVEAAAVLGPLLPRLERLMERAFDHDEEARGDPDGLEGLSRRGSPERLLLSEWGLALEAPDEFLRRAATRELLYTALAHRGQRPPPRAIVLLLDAGPGSLGAPRLAQLALVLALARRARERGVDLKIGELGAPSRGLITSDGTARVLEVLALRSRALPPADAAERWCAALGSAPVRGLWVVGMAGLDAPPPRGWSLLRITEDPGGEDRLHLELSRDGRPLGRLELTGLGVEGQAALLKDPLQASPAPLRRPLASGLAWNPDLFRFVARGEYLVGQVRPGQLLAWVLEGKARFRRKSRRHLYYDSEQTLLAIGWAWRRLVAITEDARGLTIWRSGFDPTVVSTAGLHARPVRGRTIATLIGAQRLPVPQPDYYFVDGAAQLWRLGLDGSIARYPAPVSAVGEDQDFGLRLLSADAFVALTVEEHARFVAVTPGAEVPALPPPAEGWVGGTPRYHQGDDLRLAGVAVRRTGPDTVQILQTKGAPQPLRHDPQLRILGPTGFTTIRGNVPVLAALRPGDMTLGVILESGSFQELMQVDARCGGVALSPSAARAAWVDDADQLHILNLCTRHEERVAMGALT